MTQVDRTRRVRWSAGLVVYAALAGPAAAQPAYLIYVADAGDRALSIVDPSGGAVGTIPLDGTPHRLTATADGRMLYVTMRSPDRVLAIDAASRLVVSSFIVGNLPEGIAIDHAEHFVYVTNVGDDTVTAIDIVNEMVVQPAVPVGGGPTAIALTRDDGYAYVTNADSHDVSVIALRPSPSEVARVALDDPIAVAIDPTGTRAYVVNFSSSSVSVIDTDPTSPTFNEVVEAGIGVGAQPSSIAIGDIPGRGVEAFVGCYGDASVSVIGAAPGTPEFNSVTTITGLLGGATAIALAPDGLTAFVGQFLADDISAESQGILSRIDTAVNHVLSGAVGVGQFPLAIIVAPAPFLPTPTSTRSVTRTPTPTVPRTPAVTATSTATPSTTITGTPPTATATPTPSETSTPRLVAGDCNGNGYGTVDEIVLAVNIALSGNPDLLAMCEAADLNRDRVVAVNELFRILGTALDDGRRSEGPAPTPARGVVSIDVGSTSGSPGESVTFDVRLETMGEMVVATQNDITFSLETPIDSDDFYDVACSVNPEIKRRSTSFAFLPPGCTPGTDCTGIRAIVVSLDRLDPIPTGSVLYTCSLTISTGAPSGEYPLQIEEAFATDGDGHPLQTGGRSGAVIVVGGFPPTETATATATASPTPGKPCVDDVPCPNGLKCRQYLQDAVAIFHGKPVAQAKQCCRVGATQCPVCVGDCDGNHQVIVNELIIMINVSLARQSISMCRAGDRDDDSAIKVDELVAGVHRALLSCPEFLPE